MPILVPYQAVRLASREALAILEEAEAWMWNTSSWITREVKVRWRSSYHLTDGPVKAPKGIRLLLGWKEGLEPVPVPAS